jgi:hypothetical protein
MGRLTSSVIACQFRNRSGFHILVLHGREGNHFAHHAADARPPDTGTHQHLVGFDAAFVGDDGLNLAIHHFDIHHGGVAVEFCRSQLRA